MSYLKTRKKPNALILLPLKGWIKHLLAIVLVAFLKLVTASFKTFNIIQMLKQRTQTYFRLNNELSSLSSKNIQKLFIGSEVGRGWGINHTINFSGKKIFIKRIPLTQKELENQFSTKNLFNLPTFYNYGVGSAGFGAFRELNLHIKTTNWVLNDEIENFPLMYHYRIISKEEKPNQIDREKHKKYVEYWNSNKNIDHYVLERKQAKYEIILFLEYIPFTVKDWLPKNISKFNRLVVDMKKVTTFLKKEGVIHFDLHFGNILTDGKSAFLTDFGLCLDKRFELSAKEKKFFKDHLDYDYDEFVSCFIHILTGYLGKLSKKNQTFIKNKLEIPSEISNLEMMRKLLSNIDELLKLKFIKLDKDFLKFLKKNKNVILSMSAFYTNLRSSNKKSLKYPYWIHIHK